MVRLTDHPDMTYDIYRGRKTTTQQLCNNAGKSYMLNMSIQKWFSDHGDGSTLKILKFGTPQRIAIIVLKIEKFDVTLH